jgi:hypothetical protein
MRTTFVRSTIAGLTLAAMAAFAPALAETMQFKGDLKGTNEVPPNNSNAAGNFTAAYDTATKQLTWTVNYSGLSGNVTGAHFHGPATPDKNAGARSKAARPSPMPKPPIWKRDDGM